ncbi:MAG: cell envelope integrity protein TolA [Gilliamella sp.]|nr:cell envelope integrity protein TolA [Gilliamella sp.]MCO6544962.1 cell envelope integrity protein TolA [Gilliamella sp.]MCO6548876.1 cell envelope integrity protein TolA [Gilliamella sp.]
MSYKPNSKLSIAIVISIILHIILIIILGYRVMYNNDINYGSVNGNSIDAIMVDPSIMAEQYQRQLKTQISQKRAEQQRKQQIDEQTQALQEQQLAQRQRLKELEKERLKVEELQKKEAEAAQAARIARQKEDDERKAKEQLEEQQRQAEKKRLEQQQAELAKQKEEQAKKQAAEKAKRAAQAKKDKEIDNLLGGLTSGTPSPSGGTVSRKGVSDGEIDKYKSLVQNAISNKFINPNKLYSGRNCVLEIQIAPDGLLLNVSAKGGDGSLCREALSATKQAVIPKPNSLFYNQVKTMIIDFQPK